MNASKRMKYASTPTYGMQKRGAQKKVPVAPQPSAPDFTQVPFPEVPAMPPITGPIQTSALPFAPGAFPGAMGSFPSPAYNPSPQGIQGMHQGSLPMAPQPLPFGSPSFLQSVPTQGQPLPPLGNSPLVSVPSTPSFSPRQQGYIPPSLGQAPSPGMMAQPMPGQPAAYRPPEGGPSMTPFHPMGQAPAGTFAPGGFSPVMSGPFSPPLGQGMNTPRMGAQPMGMQPGMPSAMQPGMQAAMQPGMQPMMPAMAQGPFSPPAAPKAQRQPMDWDKVLLFYLFGILPLLFIPCMFVAPAMDFLRYSFIVLCVIGLGAMWYRQMFIPSTRTTLSIVYAALCIVILSMLLGGSRDAQQTNAASGMPRNAQTTMEPGQNANPYAAGYTQAPPEVTPAPPVGLGESEAEQRLITFMEYWSINRTEDMVSLVQPSWATSKENPAAQLFNVLMNRTPEEYTIESISGSEADTSRTVTMSAYINKNNGKDPVRYRFMIMMVKEGGEWYVDPNSLATNDMQVEATDASGATTIGLATPAPRTFVTPVPSGDTKLYYNPDGGSFYHADPECSSVKQQYLPLAGSFLYKDLSQHSNLQPCLKCGAPTTALD